MGKPLSYSDFLEQNPGGDENSYGNYMSDNFGGDPVDQSKPKPIVPPPGAIAPPPADVPSSPNNPVGANPLPIAATPIQQKPAPTGGPASPNAPTAPKPPIAAPPTPFQTPDPLAFTPPTPTPAPLPTAAATTPQMNQTGAAVNVTPQSASGLPEGYTRGSGTDAGSFYYNGQKLEGMDDQGNAILAGGARGANIKSALDSLQPTINTETTKAIDANTLKQMQGSSNPSISTLANDPTFANLFGSDTGIGSNGSLIDKSGQTIAPANATLASEEAAYNGATSPQSAGQPNGLPPLPSAPTPAPVSVPAPLSMPLNGLPSGMPQTPPSSSLPAMPGQLSAIPSAGGLPNGMPQTPPSPSLPNTPAIPASGGTGGTGGASGTGGSAPSLNGLPATSGALSAVNLTPTTPQNALTNSTITPGPATDRFRIAQQQYNDWQQQTDPQFQAANRDAIRSAAAGGAIGSGRLNTSLGDIELNRENAMRSSRDTFLNNALTGSIDDAYKNIGIAQQQQGFQSGQQQIAFGQNVQLQQLADSEQGQQYQQLMASMGFNAQQTQQAFQNAYQVQQMSNDQTGQAFYRALQEAMFGAQGDPSQIDAWLAQMYAAPQGYSGSVK